MFRGLYQKKPPDSIQICFFQELSIVYKIHHMKQAMEILNVFKLYFRVSQDISDEIQTMISFIKDELQTSVKNVIFLLNSGSLFWLHSDRKNVF